MELTVLMQQVESLEINNDQELENANQLAKETNKLIKEVKASHKEEISKYHQLHKEAKAKEKDDLKPLENAKSIINKAIGKYMKKVEQKRLEIVKQQQEEQEIFGSVITQDKEIDLQGTHVRKTWKARIVDESKVPTTYKNHVIRVIDMKALNDIAKFEQGQAKIEGVEFYQDETVIVR